MRGEGEKGGGVKAGSGNLKTGGWGKGGGEDPNTYKLESGGLREVS